MEEKLNFKLDEVQQKVREIYDKGGFTGLAEALKDPSVPEEVKKYIYDGFKRLLDAIMSID